MGNSKCTVNNNHMNHIHNMFSSAINKCNFVSRIIIETVECQPLHQLFSSSRSQEDVNNVEYNSFCCLTLLV